MSGSPTGSCARTRISPTPTSRRLDTSSARCAYERSSAIGATEALAERAGALFADAGERAFAALDLITAGDLLGRAAALLPEDSPRRLDIVPTLGRALRRPDGR